MEQSSAEQRPVPTPRPRKQILLSANETNATAYENVEIADFKNKNYAIDVTNKLQNNKTIISATDYRNVITEMNNLNFDKNKNVETKNKLNSLTCEDAQQRPVPAPRKSNVSRSMSVDDADDVYENIAGGSSSSSSGGAISKNVIRRAAPTAPQSNFVGGTKQRHNSVSHTIDEAVERHMLRKSKSNTSVNSATSSTDSSPKYSTSSPGEILKSISATSKLLTESISERVTVRTKDAKNKIDKIQKSSLDLLSETKKSATTRLKNVRKNINKIGDNFSLGRSDPIVRTATIPEYNPDRPQTVPVNDEMFQSISFRSPLKGKSVNSYNLTVESSYDQVSPYPRPCSGDVILLDANRCPTYEESEALHSNTSVYPLTTDSSSGSLNLAHKTDAAFIRNSNLTQSMFSQHDNNVSPLPAIRLKIKSETNLAETEDPRSPSPINAAPCPSYPAPINKEGIYGRLCQVTSYSSSTESEHSPIRAPTRQKRRKDYEQTNLRPKPSVQTSSPTDNHSNRATIDSNEFKTVRDDRFVQIFSRDVSTDFSEQIEMEQKLIPAANRSESWKFYDVLTNEDDDDSGASSPEPIYANDVNALVDPQPLPSPRLLPPPSPKIVQPISLSNPPQPDPEAVYGVLYNQEETTELPLLTPQTIDRRNKAKSLKMDQSATDILKEFDPLIVSTVDQIFSNKSNELILLETLLGEETYGTVDLQSGNSPELSDEDEDSLEESSAALPPIPQRQDSLTDNSAVGESSLENRKTVIIHQNMKLRSDSMENILAEEAAVAPYLAQVVDIPTGELNDLSRPTPSRSHWFLDSEDSNASSSTKFSKNNSINPVNDKNLEKPHDKVHKNPIKLSKNDKSAPPSYSEAVGEQIMTASTISSLEEKPNTTKTSSMKSIFSNVLNKGMNLSIKRRPSLKGAPGKSDVKKIIEMIPKPLLTQRHIIHEGHLIRLPSGVVDDILKEQHLRKAYIRDRKFQAYFDKELKTAKENFLLDNITTIQCVSNHKFTNNSMEIYCFEITTAITKTPQSFSMSNPNMLITSADSGNMKYQRFGHLYGVNKEAERYIWMQKLLESMTDVFPCGFTCKFYRAGWCYLKNSITSEWSGAWVLLQKQKRKLLFYNYSDCNLECMDLRKARCLVLKESDESIKNLHIEGGPMLMIDCPPYSLYMIMCSPRETKIWRHIIKEVAHNNGPALKEQQLTKYDVPVLVDKCINFIYAHGSMTEGIYRKSGSENSITKLLNLFRTDAFSVQIIRSEYTEHDVANALKRFMRDLPEKLLGKYSASFISVSEMRKKTEKITAYKELLDRLPTIENHTLKKLIGHLNFIQSQKLRNKMGVDNLAMIWGPTLLQDKNAEMQYSQKEADVIMDLIQLYKNLFQLTADEVAKEQIMLSVLQKYHIAAENLSDSVKQSGDLKVWITIDPYPDESSAEEKQQINVTLTPTKTVYDVCKELAPKLNKPPFAITLSEIILSGDLYRPLHYSEKVFDVVLKWSYWPEADRKNNFLRLSPMRILKDVERALKNLPSVSPNKELKFADFKTKSFKSFTLELSGPHITVMKKEKNSITNVRSIDLKSSTAYIGCEKKRDFQLRWAITLIDQTDASKNILRTRESPFIGHVIAGTNSNDSIVWYSSILHSLYGDDIMPNPEIIIP